MKTSKHPLGTLVETDVLVIGAGASGCGAALGARDQGLDVVIMDKGKLESCGAIGGGNDHYMAVLDEPGAPFDTVDDLIKFYAKPLNGYTPTMLREGWYNHMRYFLDKLGKAGVDFSKKADGTYLRTQGFGQPGHWWIHISNGMTIKRAMARVVRAAGVELRVLAETGATAVMVARGTYGNPWVFSGHEPSASERVAAFECHVRLLEATGAHLKRARSLAGWYFKGMPEAACARTCCRVCASGSRDFCGRKSGPSFWPNWENSISRTTFAAANVVV